MAAPKPIADENYLNFLKEMITGERLKRFAEVLDLRTRYITIVLEDIYQSQNASAVLRTCELTGVQDVHIIENRYRFEVHPDIVLGSSKWLSIYRYNKDENNSITAIHSLREQGYRIIATSPKPEATLLQELNLDKPIALLFGTEKQGLSETAFSLADETVSIPMAGFTESFNISVSAAIILFTLTTRLRASANEWKLNEAERNAVLMDWCRRSLRNIKIIERNYYKKHPP
jgi:tRNA (guanosine-2'-O-)-methyltransferase